MFPFPVLANGDIFDAHDVRRALDVTGADGVLIARGALGNPWIFVQAIELLTTGATQTVPHIRRTFFLDLDTQKRHIAQYGGRGIVHFVNICRGTKGMEGAKAFRSSLCACEYPRRTHGTGTTFSCDETPMPLSRMPSPQPKSYSHIA